MTTTQSKSDFWQEHLNAWKNSNLSQATYWRSKQNKPRRKLLPVPIPALDTPVALPGGIQMQLSVSALEQTPPPACQEKIFSRIGVDLPHNILAGWVIRCGQAPPSKCDETPVQEPKEPDKPPESQSYMSMRLGDVPNSLRLPPQPQREGGQPPAVRR